MDALLDVILPVFLVIAFGYAAARARLFDDAAVDGLMRFAQNFAVPTLLFASIAKLDLAASFQPALFLSFYIAAFTSFGVAFAAAILVFRRPVTDATAIGFVALFSNSLLLGVPLTERAYGPDALAGNYAIISIHAPMFYAFGIALMEWARTRGHGLSSRALLRQILRAIFSQPMVLGILAGFAVNLTGLPLPQVALSAVDLIARTAIPTALFGLGGVLLRYRPDGDFRIIAVVCACSLVLHPGLAYLLGRFAFGLDTAGLRSAVMTAAMAPGVNAYIFANLYGVGKRVAASTVLVATALSILTVWVWLHILP
ncbi:AEC family transporter [Paragemmobacter straminiformis]|uniref:AEC family transporter n=1 Tax=Paragemmobacter straminiformis TaxID=2045119 RepID=A0A842ICT9_9RHOB|nr:AEC family transporter [Gemmobacter straminiformis]MBC2837455.1 AEC family transporter [Gemmobacter straminiformis]